jgi:hypothetical protein
MAADLAERRRTAGLPVVLHDEPGATHAMSVLGPEHPRPWAALLDFLRQLDGPNASRTAFDPTVDRSR